MPAETGVQVQDPDPNTNRAKPPGTPPEIRRKIAELEGRCKSHYADYSKDGRAVTDEEFTRLETISAEVVQLQRQLAAAERWGAVEGTLGRSQHGSGRVADPIDMPHNDPANTHNGRHQYSILKAYRSRMDPSQYPLDGIEKETHEEMLKDRQRSGLKTKGVLIPLDLPVDLAASYRWAKRSGFGRKVLADMMQTRAEMRALDTSAGAGSIPTILDTTMIELLRARMVTYALGARVMTDMQGLFSIPRQKSASTFYMVGQGIAITGSNQTIDQVPFSPHTGGVNTTYTRQFLEQTNQDAEMFVREDQAAVVARGVETAALNGQASAGYPMGILQNPQIGVYSLGTNGAAPTWLELVALESYVAYFNADVGTLGYVTTALMRGTYKTTLKVGSTFPIYLWNTESPEAPLNGYPCYVTNLLPQNLTKGSSGAVCHPTIFGNWEDLVYAFWSGMDTIVDPYTLADSGGVRIVTLQDFDVNVRHFESFASCVDQLSAITAPIT